MSQDTSHVMKGEGFTYFWSKLKAYLTGAHVSSSAVSGQTTVDGALSSLSQQIDNVRALTGPYKFRIDSNPSSATYNHLLMDYEDGYSPSNWSVPSSGQYEGHLIYTFTY